MANTHEEVIVSAPELLEHAPVARSRSPERHRTFVRELAGRYNDIYKKLFDEPRVIHSKDVLWGGGPQQFGKSVIDPDTVDSTQLFHCHFELLGPGGKSQKHGHMNTAVFYILEGEGYDVHDGVRLDWKAGDACIVTPGCVHQHFNADPDQQAKMLVIKAKPIYLFVNLGFQGFVERSPSEPVPGYEGWLPQEVIDQGGLGEAGAD